MKNKAKELDVNFIGGQDPMTKEEQLAISEFIKTQKLLRMKKEKRVARPAKQRRKIET